MVNADGGMTRTDRQMNVDSSTRRVHRSHDRPLTRTLETHEFGERGVQFDSDQTEFVPLANQLVCSTASNSSIGLHL